MSARSALDRSVFLVHLLAASLSLGAPLFFAVAVAPASFRLLPNRQLAGDLNGAILGTLTLLLEVGFAVLLATTWLLTRSGGKSRILLLLRRLPVLAFVAALTIHAVLIPSLDRLRRSLPVGTGLAAAAPALRSRFERLHAFSVSLLLLDILSAFALLALASRFYAAPEPSVPQVPRLPIA